MKTTILFSLALGALVLPTTAQTVASTSSPQYSVVDRGPFWRTWQRTTHSTNFPTGATLDNVESYVELEAAACYQNESGQWVDSQDLIEVTPSGAAAVHGLTKAYFAANINTAGAIALRSGGQVFQSHPIGLYYRDLASGKVTLIAPVQDCVGVLIPPNEVVYSNALSGLRASITYVYTHNAFDQSVVLHEAPPPPDTLAGFDPTTSRLEIWTSLDQWPAPAEQRPVVLKQGANPQLDLVDHLLFFGDSWFPVGTAFLSQDLTPSGPGQPVRVHLADPSDPNNVLVAKSIVRIGNQTVLVESANYQDLLPKLQTLEQAAQPADRSRFDQALTQGRQLPTLAALAQPRHPISLGSRGNLPKGVVIDYTTLSGTTNTYIFSSGTTYLIPTSFYVTGTATFQTNAFIKFASNAWLIANGSASFPSSGWPVIFTSADDNVYGQVINTSTGYPNYAAAQELWFYYPTASQTVQDAHFRWAQQGVHYDQNSNAGITQYIVSSAFENTSTPIYDNMPGSTLYLSGDTTCNTKYGVSKTYNSTVSGSLTVNCGVANASKMLGEQAETSIAISPVTPSTIVAFANNIDSVGSQNGLLYGRSTDSGATWTSTVIATGKSPDNLPATAGDPWAAFDSLGNLFLAYVATQPDGTGCSALGADLVVALSTDAGASFTVLTTFVNTGGFDKPMITTGPSSTPGISSVWLTYLSYNSGSCNDFITVSGANVTNLGVVGSFSTFTPPDTSSDTELPSIAVGPTGQVLVAWLTSNGSQLVIDQNVNGLSSPNWVHTTNLNVTLHVTDHIPAQNNRGIRNYPLLVWDRSNTAHGGTVHLVYTDYTTSSTDTDIYVVHSTDNGASFTNPLKVNDDASALSQFLPAAAIDQSSGNLAICWYDCRDDSNNVKTRAYCAISRDGGVTFSKNFLLEPLQSDVTLLQTGGGFQYGDYSGLDYSQGFLRFVWANNSNSTGDNPDGVHGMDVYTSVLGY